jgi:hypothetical protein
MKKSTLLAGILAALAAAPLATAQNFYQVNPKGSGCKS